MTVRLSWARSVAANECASGDSIESDVRRRLGRDPFTGPPGHSIEGFVDRNDGRWRARLVVRDGAGTVVGERVLESAAAACTSLDAAVALALALVIDPEASLAAPPPIDRPVAGPIVATPVEVPPLIPARGPRGSVFASFVGSISLLPAVSAGATLGADVELLGAWHAQAELSFFPETRVESDTNGFAFGLSAGGIGTSVVLGDDFWSLSLGASILIGAIHAVPISLTPVAPGDRAWAALRAGARGTLRLMGPLELVVGLSAIVPLIDYTFRIEDHREAVWKMEPIAATGEIGLGMAFW